MKYIQIYFPGLKGDWVRRKSIMMQIMKQKNQKCSSSLSTMWHKSLISVFHISEV